MFGSIKKRLYLWIFVLFVAIWLLCPLQNSYAEKLPTYEKSYVKWLGDWRTIDREWVDKNKSLLENVELLFYPWNENNGKNRIFNVLRDITLWMMIVFFVIAWASLLLNRKSEDNKKALYSILYIMLWWVFIYWANWLFGSVFTFDGGSLSTSWQWAEWVTLSLVGPWSVMFKVLSAIKAFAFFLAIIMIVVTWFKVISAWEWDKWKKLVKWLINVVVALLVIKWVDFIYYMAADSENFAQRAADFIINVAKIFGYIYGIVIVIMVIVAWYLYITDGWSWSNFKKATNVLVNILLSWLVLFSFLLILYQIFAEFQTGGDAVTEAPTESTTFLTVDKNYV